MKIYKVQEEKKARKKPMRTLGESVSSGRLNNMDAIRFVAALAVIISHSFAIAGYEEPRVGSITLGLMGVAVFFSLSGYLITSSWNNHPRASAFIGKRVLRIVPGLAGATFFTAFVVGLIYTSLPVKEYLLSRETLEYLNNFLIYGMSATLPGLFTQNPIAGAVNGSLWTLPYEFTAYIVIAVLGLSLLLSKARTMIFLFLSIVIMAYIVEYLGLSFSIPIINLHIEPLFKLLGFFFAGSLVFIIRDRIPCSPLILIMLILMFMVFRGTSLEYILSVLSISYATILISYSRRLRLYNFGRYGDFSYGMYIYSFPIQQSIITSLPNAKPVAVFLIAFPVTLIMAVTSWHIIEAPALSLKRIFTKNRYPMLKVNKQSIFSYSVRNI